MFCNIFTANPNGSPPNAVFLSHLCMSIHWPVTLLVRGSAQLLAQGVRRVQRTQATLLEAPALEGLLLTPGSWKRFWSPVIHILILPTASERPPSILHQESFHSHKVQNQSPNQSPSQFPTYQHLSCSPGEFADHIWKVHYPAPKGEGEPGFFKYKPLLSGESIRASTPTPLNGGSSNTITPKTQRAS